MQLGQFKLTVVKGQGQCSLTISSLWLCHWVTGGKSSPVQSHLPSVSKRNSSDGEVHRGGTWTGINMPRHLSSICRILLCEETRGWSPACADYWSVNQVMAKYHYSLSLIPAALEQLQEARIFTKPDLQSTYNLVCVREGNKWKTAFCTSSGHFEHCVMPYGLSSAPAVFQYLINDIL